VKKTDFRTGFISARVFELYITRPILILKTPITNFTKIRPVAAELFHAEKATDRHDEALGKY
jgi:hypothetical protein